jgi:hypothetical protein
MLSDKSDQFDDLARAGGRRVALGRGVQDRFRTVVRLEQEAGLPTVVPAKITPATSRQES